MNKTMILAAALLLTSTYAAAAPQFLQPIDQTSGDYQASFGGPTDGTNGEDLWFEVTLDSVPSDGDLTLQRKASGSHTFSDVDTVEAISDYSEQSYHFNVANEYSISDGGSTTFTVNGNEHTFELDSVVDSNTISMYVDGQLENYDLGDDIYVEGQSNSPVTLHEIIDTGSGTGQITLQKFNRINVPEFESSYRVVYDGSDYSRQIYTAVDQTGSTPYLVKTEVNGTQVFPYNRVGGIAPTSSIGAVVDQEENDDYNITLVDEGTGTEIVEVSTGSPDGIYLNYLTDTFYGVQKFLLGPNSADDYSLPTGGSTLLDASGQNEDYSFHIEDLDDSSNSRVTPIFQLSTSGTNAAPAITAVEGYNSSVWKNLTKFNEYQEPLNKIRVSVSDPNNKFHGVELYLEDVYDGSVRLNYSTDYSTENSVYTYNLSSSIDDSGNWTAAVNVTDGSKFDYESLNWSVPWGNLSATYYVESGTVNYTVNKSESFTGEVEVTCTGGECASEGEEVKAYYDPKPVEKPGLFQKFLEWILNPEVL